jgi:cell division protein FtsI/penicillin-binding protein 2
VAIDVDTKKVDDAGATAGRLADVVDVKASALEQAIEKAGPGHFVPVITLRKADYDKVAEELQDVPGVSIAPGTAPLAPTKTFARAVLGAVGPATAEQVEKSEGRLGTGDTVGQWGLQAAFDKQLAGTPSRSVVIRDVEDGVVEKTLKRWRGRRPENLATTLDLDVQQAAEQALGETDKKEALVALQPSTGDILAVANRPSDSTLDRALTGLYPPGSTFKVITTAALLRDGLSVDQTVPCPATKVVDGRAFRNFEGGAAGDVPFRTDFAQSCNTAFVSLAGRLSRSALPETAKDFGLGEQLKLGLPAADGQVPEGETPVAREAMMIGQDRIVASPLIMAGVAGTVAAGRWHAPRLLDDDPKTTGPKLGDGEAATLRELMRSVVTSGTGTALSGLPGFVAGKSGTAEYGGGDPPPTHAWFIAFRGDLAGAVLVEGGKAGGTVAAPIADRFLEALPG